MAIRLSKATGVLLASVLVVAWAAFVALNGGPIYFVVAPIVGRVIDAETRQPIPNTIVTANWELVTGSLDGAHSKGQLEVMETVTDDEGRFKFPGFTSLNPMGYELRASDPQLLMFKAGYLPDRWANPDYMRSFNRNPRRVSSANGRIFGLKRFVGTAGEYAVQLGFLGSDLHFATWGQACEWKKIPRMLVAVDQLKQEMGRLGASPDLPSMQSLSGGPFCGSPADFFAGYGR